MKEIQDLLQKKHIQQTSQNNKILESFQKLQELLKKGQESQERSIENLAKSIKQFQTSAERIAITTRNDAARRHNKVFRDRLEELCNNDGVKPSNASQPIWFPATNNDFSRLYSYQKGDADKYVI